MSIQNRTPDDLARGLLPPCNPFHDEVLTATGPGVIALALASRATSDNPAALIYLYRGTEPGFIPNPQNCITIPPHQTQFIDTGLTVGRRYYYRTSSLYFAGESPYSPEFSDVAVMPASG